MKNTDSQKTAASTTLPRAGVSATLVALAFLCALLALFQWMELLLLHAGGKTVCAISAQVNCEAVWRLPFAKWVHATLGVPVAGMGLVWAIAAFVTALRLLSVRGVESRTGAAIAAVRITGFIGIVSSAGLAALSLKAGVVCPTCLGTYALTLAFGLVALFGLPKPLWPQGSALTSGVAWAAVSALLAYAAVYAPGRATPRSGEVDLPKPPVLSNTPPNATGAADGGVATTTNGTKEPTLTTQEEAIARYIAALPSGQQKGIAQSLAILRASPKVDVKAHPSRNFDGPKDAPVHIVEWTDVLCGHCAELTNTMKWLRKAAPPGSFSMEARHFPLDGACNPEIKQRSPNSVRCDGARALVCLESAPDFWTLRKKIFDAQMELSPEKILQLATSSGTVKRDALEKCMKSPETDAKLRADVAYGMKYKPEGTPIVTINGRAGTPLPAFLFSIVGAKGDPESSAFAKVPRVAVPKNDHAGHNH